MNRTHTLTVNALYLKIIEYGKAALNGEDSDNIAALAVQYPYIGGSAVYKARALYAMYVPASMFDDIKICNPIGVYKNGNSTQSTSVFDAENIYLKSLKATPQKVSLSATQLILYPNPTNSQLNVKYKAVKDTRLQLLNMLGVIVQEINLPKNVQCVMTTIGNLSPGVYIYRQTDNKEVLNTGKLIIGN